LLHFVFRSDNDLAADTNAVAHAGTNAIAHATTHAGSNADAHACTNAAADTGTNAAADARPNAVAHARTNAAADARPNAVAHARTNAAAHACPNAAADTGTNATADTGTNAAADADAGADVWPPNAAAQPNANNDEDAHGDSLAFAGGDFHPAAGDSDLYAVAHAITDANTVTVTHSRRRYPESRLDRACTFERTHPVRRGAGSFRHGAGDLFTVEYLD